jgi:hypothetical protein
MAVITGETASLSSGLVADDSKPGIFTYKIC